jgi:hypothetical protein
LIWQSVPPRKSDRYHIDLKRKSNFEIVWKQPLKGLEVAVVVARTIVVTVVFEVIAPFDYNLDKVKTYGGTL